MTDTPPEPSGADHMLLRQRVVRECAAAMHVATRERRMIACGSGGNRFPELLSAAQELRNLEGKDWDVAAGISAGALVAGLISQIPKNDLNAFNHDFDRAKCKFMRDAEASPFRPHVPLGEFANALFCVLAGKESLFKGMSSFVKKEFDERRFRCSGRRLLVGVFDNETQSYRTVDGDNEPSEIVRQAIEASCSIPVAMPAVNVSGIGRCRDGGLVHTIPIEECLRFIEDNQREGVPCHIDLLISDSIQNPPPHQKECTVTSSLVDVTTSLVWLNLERDLVDLSRVLGDTHGEQQTALHLLRSGKKRNFQRPWGSIRIVAPMSLSPKRRPRTSFRVPDKRIAETLVADGARAARSSM